MPVPGWLTPTNFPPASQRLWAQEDGRKTENHPHRVPDKQLQKSGLKSDLRCPLPTVTVPRPPHLQGWFFWLGPRGPVAGLEKPHRPPVYPLLLQMGRRAHRVCLLKQPSLKLPDHSSLGLGTHMGAHAREKGLTDTWVVTIHRHTSQSLVPQHEAVPPALLPATRGFPIQRAGFWIFLFFSFFETRVSIC